MAVRSMADLLKEQEDATRPAPPPTATDRSQGRGSVAKITGDIEGGFELSPAPPRPRARSRPGTGARAAVAAARLSSRREPRAWPAFTAQVPDTLSARLALRLARDQEASGDFRLGLLHYLNAAYAAIPQAPLEAWIAPGDPPEAVLLALAWRERGSAHRRLIRSGSSLHQDVARAMHELVRRLKLLPDPVLAWEVQAEALTRLLDELDAEQA